MATFTINQRYSFNTAAPDILGAAYNNVKLTGITNYEIANLFFWKEKNENY